jgi:tetratricopeptide (TPR) repeat protein
VLLSDQPLPPDRLARWRLILEARARRLAERGLRHVILVAPDAFTVCADDLPEGWPRPKQAIGEIFARAMAGIDNLTVVYPIEALRADGGGGLPAYKANDTHWSAWGAFVAYGEMMAALPPGMDVRRLSGTDVAFTMKDAYGNLGAHADFDRKEPTPAPAVGGPRPRLVRRSAGPRRTALAVTRAEGPTARALLLRDSFATEMGPFLTASFGELWMVGPSQDLDLDLVEAARPEVVILQTSERRLLHLPTDHPAFGWREQFDVDAAGPAGKACARLLQALAAGDVEAAADLATEVAAGEGVQPQHLIHCAEACRLAGRPADQAAYARAAAARDPSFASAWRLIALAELGSDRPDEQAWAEAAARMLEAAPGNALYRQQHAVGLLRFGHVEAALAELRAAIAAYPDHPALSVELAQTLNDEGDASGALAALEPVLGLYPAGSRIPRLAERLRGGRLWKGRFQTRA